LSHLEAVEGCEQLFDILCQLALDLEGGAFEPIALANEQIAKLQVRGCGRRGLRQEYPPFRGRGVLMVAGMRDQAFKTMPPLEVSRQQQLLAGRLKLARNVLRLCPAGTKTNFVSLFPLFPSAYLVARLARQFWPSWGVNCRGPVHF
jgi:hypothetical protein